ncbi:MAG: hypothetical protein OXS33_09750, partial [bacterium]|nr:hypothetical protein [bacterium]
MDKMLERLEPTQRILVEALTEALQDAPILGPLLRIEERIEAEIRAAIAGTTHGDLAQGITPEVILGIQDELLTSIQALADATTASPAERMLAAEVDNCVRFVLALLRRYDAVFQNPPFGEPVPETKAYLKAAYPWMPSRDCNLLAAFVGRGLELCQPSVGYLGAITSRTGMFLKTYDNWRQDIMIGHRLITLVDLGYGVMENAQVEAAAYVLRNQLAAPEHETTVVRLLKDTDKPAGIASATANHQQHKEDERIFNFVLSDLQAIPGSPIAYWMSPTIRRLFRNHLPIEGTAGDVRQGVATGYDFRFVRAFWEVDPSRIACSREETVSTKPWVPLAKGGDYSPYWADIHLVVNYANDGSALREYPGSVIRNPQYYFRSGLTWPGRTTSGFGPRVLPTGSIFSHTGHSLFPLKDAGAVLGLLTSRLTEALLAASLGSAESTKSGSPAKSYYVGTVQKLPWLSGLENDAAFSQLSLEVATLRQSEDLGDETTRLFVAPRVISGLLSGMTVTEAALEQKSREGDRHLRILDLTYKAEQIIHELAGLDHDAEEYLNREVGPHPASYPHGPVDECRLRTLLRTPIPRVINKFIESRGGSPAIVKKAFFADRRLEVLAHGLEYAPTQIEAYRREEGILPAGVMAIIEIPQSRSPKFPTL